MQSDKDNTFINAKSAGELLDLKPETIRMFARMGRIPYVKIGRSIRFRVSDVLALATNNIKSNPAEGAAAGEFEVEGE